MLTTHTWDERRHIALPGNTEATLTFCADHFVSAYQTAVYAHDKFCVALSGGSTPKALFQKLTSPPYIHKIDWKKVHLFWSDERAVPPDNAESNYHMAMHAGLERMPLIPSHIHRMHAEDHIEDHALDYEEQILKTLGRDPFDLIMLGMGDDGHTASLFPHTKGLHVTGRLVIANYIPQKECMRMTFTFECINQAKEAVLYVLGPSKASTVLQVLGEPDQFDLFPSQQVGTPAHPALWIFDDAAASLIKTDPRFPKT